LDQPERNPACWPYVQWVFRAFTECLAESGTFSVRSVQAGVVPQDLRAFSNYSGVFFLGPDAHREFIQQLVREQVAPVVVLGRSQRDLPCLSADENRAEGVRVGIRHLAALGYQRIAMVASEEWWGDIALEGFRRGLQDADLSFDAKRVARVPERFECSADATTAWLKRRVRFDAVIADADPRALHVLDALRAHGLRVPEDVGVMGYDGLALFGTQPPFLSSVRKPYREMIAAALEELARAPGRMTEHKHIEFIGDVVPGQTCRDSRGQRKGAPGKKQTTPV
jgi:DNA-binding LacI/PurR family transcriptional regulator